MNTLFSAHVATVISHKRFLYFFFPPLLIGLKLAGISRKIVISRPSVHESGFCKILIRITDSWWDV